MGISLMSAGGVSLDTTTAEAWDIKSGETAYNGDGELVTGTMVDQGAKKVSLAPGGSYTIPAGYHNGNGQVTAAALKTTDVWQSCHVGQNLFGFSGGTLVGVQYAGSQYASDNILQGAGINSGSQYWAQCASNASVRFVLAYY